MEIKTIKRPAGGAKRGRKGQLKEKLLALRPNDENHGLADIKKNQISGVYTTAKKAGLSISIYKMEDSDNYVAFSNGPRATEEQEN